MFSIVRTDEVNGRQTWWVTWQVSLCHHFFNDLASSYWPGLHNKQCILKNKGGSGFG